MKRRLYIKGCINEIEYVHVLLQSFTNRDQKANFIKRKMNMSAFENRKIQFFYISNCYRSFYRLHHISEARISATYTSC